ncbi:tyrosine-type recombinase/integrase [Lentzea sp. HUAS12]|uniref:tyrosine-type recombinase/integrase n=1 Tax=Lentzea sp. HUAS12 TaxID=2951806 RepID=UPI00209D1D82|nr:tyrosine-type recombinase/integrase [Lentzea sp. HUAS12]USX49462.1 tyrosine-type recombinase/integrase [Lentzea sp. HUAS12]
MSTPKRPTKGRQRGEIEPLPSGSLRVKVYAGIDPISGRRHYIYETIPAGPDAAKKAEKARTRIINEIDEQRNSTTNATVNRLMDRYLELLDVDKKTRKSYEGYIRNHIRPILGKLQVGRLNGETLDSFYSVLRRCRAHCDGRPFIEKHKTTDAHDCAEQQCTPHVCRPLAKSSIRQVHWCLSGALKRAVKWRWTGTNPLAQAETPRSVAADPHPPTPEQAAAIVNEAFKDLSWGMFVWLAMTTGARRGEVCALRLDLLDLENAVLPVKTSISQDGAETWEKDTKTHQQRRIALDPETVGLLRAYLQYRGTKADELGVKVAKDGRLFSPRFDHADWIKPDTVTQRYRRMCARLGWDMHIHSLRHYSATELIASGVDVRTVAGRLGHGGGGATTLRVYSAWVSEADQRAAGTIAGRMPTPPIKIDLSGAPVSTLEPAADNPYQKIAADLRGAITCGALKPGDLVPTVIELKTRYGVSAGTANRAIAELKANGLVNASRGKRAVVLERGEEPDAADVVSIKHKRKAE